MTASITFKQLQHLVSPRAVTSHKGDHGHVLIVGGDIGFAGAASLCATAAARVGAGLVSLATRSEHAASLSLATPEIMSHPLNQGSELKQLLRRADVIAIGPGLGQAAWGVSLFSSVIDTDLPLVVDADALNLLAEEPMHSQRWVLTPHPGEAARLLQCDTADVQSDRIAAATAIQKKFGGVIVLKGSGTVIVDQHDEPVICSDGGAGMASGGMGDVLTGVIAGLLAQQTALALATEQLVQLGVCLHSSAADHAAIDGQRGMLASDLMPWIRRLINIAD